MISNPFEIVGSIILTTSATCGSFLLFFFTTLKTLAWVIFQQHSSTSPSHHRVPVLSRLRVKVLNYLFFVFFIPSFSISYALLGTIPFLLVFTHIMAILTSILLGITRVAFIPGFTAAFSRAIDTIASFRLKFSVTYDTFFYHNLRIKTINIFVKEAN